MQIPIAPRTKEKQLVCPPFPYLKSRAKKQTTTRPRHQTSLCALPAAMVPPEDSPRHKPLKKKVGSPLHVPQHKPLGTDGLTRGYSEPAWLTTPRVHSFIADAVSVSSSVRSFKNQPSQSNRFSPHLRFQPGTGPKSLSLPLRDISSSHSRNTDNARAVASLPQLVIAAFFLMRSRNLADCLRANPASVIEVFVGTGTLSRGSSL